MATVDRSNFRCWHRQRVRWAEVDMQKVVFNGNYLMYFDTAVSEYWRALALPYEAALRQLGGDIFVKKATVEYHASAHFDEVLDLGVRCARVGNSSMLFEVAIFFGDRLIASGELVYVYTSATSQVAQPVPPALRHVLETFEAGKPMTHVQVGTWLELHEPSSALRQAVFVEEQGIAASLVWDDADASSLHVLIKNHLDQPVAAGRMSQQGPAVARIGRMAVDRALRGSRLGQDVVKALVAAARQRDDREVMLHAQCSAQGFYTRLGFQPRGAVFEEVGIAHIEMCLPLGPSEAQ